MVYKENWEETKQKWFSYWKRENTGRPLMKIIAKKNSDYAIVYPQTLEESFDPVLLDKNVRDFCENHIFFGESFPNVSVDMGPGSMAAYLGCDISLSGSSIWFEECIEDLVSAPSFIYDPENKHYKKHFETFKKVCELSKNDYYVGLPDIMDNIDVLASLCGAENTIFDLMDEPDLVVKKIDEIQSIYFDYLDSFYNLAKQNENGSDCSCYTVFHIFGKGKTLKIQCDFSAMMSPTQFKDIIVPALSKVSKKADNILYHLDGPDAIKHLDALLEIDEIDALQWTSGDYNPDGTFEQWYEIYDKAVKKNKGLWVKVYTDTINEWLPRIDALVKRYGSNALFLHFPIMSEDDAKRLLEHADKHWSDIKGSLLG